MTQPRPKIAIASYSHTKDIKSGAIAIAGVEPVLVDEDAARPHSGGDGISAYSDPFAFQVSRYLDSRIRANHEAAVMKPAHQENRQGNEWSAERARDHVGGRRHLADIELDIAHHAPECPYDGYDLDEVPLHSCDGNRPVLDSLGVPVGGDCNFQSRRLCHCFSMPAFLITAAHF